MVLWYPMGVTEILTSCSRAALNFYGHIVRTFSFGTHGEVPWSYTYHILHPRGGTEIWISCSRVLCSSQCKCARPSCLPCSLPPATCLFLPCLLLGTLHVITHDDSWYRSHVMMTRVTMPNVPFLWLHDVHIRKCSISLVISRSDNIIHEFDILTIFLQKAHVNILSISWNNLQCTSCILCCIMQPN